MYNNRGYYYDAAWNLNRRTNNTATYTFGVNVMNQLTNEPGLSDYYDSNGNLTNRNDGSYYGGYKYYYDDENRLTNVTYQTSTGSESSWWQTYFTYDGLGRLRKREEYIWLTDFGWYLNSTLYYVYDGWRVIQERGSVNPIVAYTRGTDLSGSLEGAGGIGGLLARSHSYSSGNFSTHNCYFADGNGNVVYMINSSQSMVAKYRYDPFGNSISKSGSLSDANVYRFSSKEVHASSGMYYYGYRFYDPNLQRWINPDPLGDEAAIVYATAKIDRPLEPPSIDELAAITAAVLDPLSMFTRINLNLHRATGNNPVSNVDPFGLDFASCWADCVENNRDPFGNGIAYICNAAANKAVGSTGRTGIGGAPPHPTTWQHKLGSNAGPVASKVGRAVGRLTVVLTIADGFFDLGLMIGCAAGCDR